MWQYWWYCDPRAPACPWREWYDSQDGQVKGRHDVVFKFLESRTIWKEPHAKTLGGGLVEIVLKGKVQHRLLGFCWPDRLHFTILLPCTHKGIVYDPKNALVTARERMRELRDGSTWKKRCVRPD
jgi:hypothetical protein